MTTSKTVESPPVGRFALTDLLAGLWQLHFENPETHETLFVAQRLASCDAQTLADWVADIRTRHDAYMPAGWVYVLMSQADERFTKCYASEETVRPKDIPF